jgi:hypothetical protein
VAVVHIGKSAEWRWSIEWGYGLDTRDKAARPALGPIQPPL